MQNVDSTVNSPAPSGHGLKRRRTGSFGNGPIQGGRTKKVPREELLETDDVPMEDVVSSPPPVDAAIRINGASTVAGAAAIAAATKALSDSEEWQNTIERIVKSVVSIRFSQVPLTHLSRQLLMSRLLLLIQYGPLARRFNECRSLP